MVWTFILGVLAGWCAPFADDRVKPVAEQLLPGTSLPAIEVRAVSLAVCLLIATVVAMASGSTHALPLILGAIVGVLGPRLWERFRAMRAPDYDS